MTAAIVGVFLLHHFDADWGWYAAVIGMALIEGFHHDKARAAILDQLGRIRITLGELYPRDRFHDDD